MGIFDFLFGPPVPKISVQEAYDQLKTTPKPVIVDVRQPSEVATGSVQGAVFIPLSQIGNRMGELPKNRPILTICRSGNRSTKAARKLLKAEYDVTNVAGGITAWQKAGLPLRKPGKRKRKSRA